MKRVLPLLIIFSLFVSCTNPFMEEILGRGKKKPLSGESEEFGPFDLQAEVDLYSDAVDDMTIAVPRNLILATNITIPKNSSGAALTITSTSGGPYTLTRGAVEWESRGVLFSVPAGAELIFENIIVDGNCLNADGTIKLDGNISAAIVQIESGGIFTMKNGAVLKNNVSSNGGAVLVRGTFTMNGGTINGNIASNDGTGGKGGGVFINNGGTFNMSGGTISGNTSLENGGGGVYLQDGAFTMSGGQITGNTTNVGYGPGGGVYVEGGIFMMDGGTVSGNTAADGNGGGVYVAGGTFRISNGIIYGSDADAALRNTAVGGSGAALYVNGNSCTAEYGKGNTWYSISTNSNTVFVGDGVYG